jgi:hypothetical protein
MFTGSLAAFSKTGEARVFFRSDHPYRIRNWFQPKDFSESSLR